MKRRTFIGSGAAALGIGSGTAALGSVLMPLPASNGVKSDDGDVGNRLAQGLIWCRDRIAIPLLDSGSARGIADVDHALPKETDFFCDEHVAFIRMFSIDHPVTVADLYLLAFTRYRLSINGIYIGRGPSRYENQRPEYDCWSVGAHLRPGVNRICALVHRDSPTGRIAYHAPGFAAVLICQTAEGTSHLSTDDRWLATPESSFMARDIAWSSIPEQIDARKFDDWLVPTYDCSLWPNAIPLPGRSCVIPQPRSSPMLRETVLSWQDVFVARRIAVGESAVFALEYPTLAYHRLSFDADPGSQILVQYELPEGQSSGQSFYIARAGLQTWMGGDSFAFSKITLSVLSGSIKLLEAVVVQLLYPFEVVGNFYCNDASLSRLWQLCARSLVCLSEDAYIDCADRERVEWIDNSPPAYDCTRVMMAGPGATGHPAFGDPRLLKSLLQRIALTQTRDGQIKAHSCSERWDIHAIMEDRSCNWIILLHQYYKDTGDSTFVRQLWPSVIRLIAWFLGKRTNRGLVLAREWEVWDNPLRYQICEGAGLNAFVYHALSASVELAGRIGRFSDKRRLQRAANELAVAFNTHLWNDRDGTYWGGLFGEGSRMQEQLNGKLFSGPLEQGRYRPTLQAALFAVDAEIVPPHRLHQVHQWIVAHRDEATQCMSHYFLFKVLYGLQCDDLDRMVLHRMKEKWQPMVDSPWGTSWERFEGDGGSKMHIYGIIPAYFLSSYVLGVKVVGDIGGRRLEIAPRPGDLTSAGGIVVTPFGPVPIRWRRDGRKGFHLSVTVPSGCRASVRLPADAIGTIFVNGRAIARSAGNRKYECELSAGFSQIDQQQT